MQEISECIHALFDGYLISFDLSQDFFSSRSPNAYVLNINVEISVADGLRDGGLTSMSALSRGYIGEYRPRTVDQYQDHRHANNVIRFQYSISDLDDFIMQLRKHAWTIYSTRMNNAIDNMLNKK